MTFLIFFAIGFVLIIVARTAGHILLAPFRALLNAIVGQIMKRLELQKARLRILDDIAGNPPPEQKPETIEDQAARQLYRASRRR